MQSPLPIPIVALTLILATTHSHAVEEVDPTPPLAIRDSTNSPDSRLAAARAWAESVARFPNRDLLVPIDFWELGLNKEREITLKDGTKAKLSLMKSMHRPLLDASLFSSWIEHVADSQTIRTDEGWIAEKNKFISTIITEAAEPEVTATLWDEFLSEWKVTLDRTTTEDKFRDALAESSLVMTGVLLGFEKESLLAALKGTEPAVIVKPLPSEQVSISPNHLQQLVLMQRWNRQILTFTRVEGLVVDIDFFSNAIERHSIEIDMVQRLHVAMYAVANSYSAESPPNLFADAWGQQKTQIVLDSNTDRLLQEWEARVDKTRFRQALLEAPIILMGLMLQVEPEMIRKGMTNLQTASRQLSPQILCSFAFGLVLLVVIVVLILFGRGERTGFEYLALRVLLATGVASAGGLIVGFLTVAFEPVTGVSIQAGGALALFVMVYVLNPPAPPKVPKKPIASPKEREKLPAGCIRLDGIDSLYGVSESRDAEASDEMGIVISMRFTNVTRFLLRASVRSLKVVFPDCGGATYDQGPFGDVIVYPNSGFTFKSPLMSDVRCRSKEHFVMSVEYVLSYAIDGSKDKRESSKRLSVCCIPGSVDKPGENIINLESEVES